MSAVAASSIPGPALAILELSSIARGVVTSDAVLKRAEVTILASRPVSSGRFLLFFCGGVAEVEEAMAAGRERAGAALLDSLLLPMAHDQLWRLLPDPVVGEGWSDRDDLAAAIVETTTVCAAVAGADAACKAADVVVRDMRLAVGIAGKGFFSLTGELCDVEAAVEAAVDAGADRIVATEVIAAPAGEILGRLIC